MKRSTAVVDNRSQVDRALPKYRELAHRLREQIVAGDLRAGDRLPTFPQMNQRYGATQKTVEQAYALLEQEGLILRRPGSGVYVRDTERPVAKGVIAIADGFPAQHPYFIHLLNGVYDAARECQVEVLLLHANSLIGWDKVDGVLSADPYPENFLYRLPHGMLLVSLLHPLANTSSVVTDDRAALSRTVAQLVELGHRKIAYFTQGHLFEGGPAPTRFAGYCEGLAAAGIPFQKSWLRPSSKPEKIEPDSRKLGHEEMSKWLRTDWDESGVTAILAHNDDIAMGILDALQEARIKVPQDVSVIGFDGLDLSHPWCGTLSSVGVPLFEIGRRGMELMVKAVRRPLSAQSTPEWAWVEIPSHFKPGQSSGEVRRQH